MPLSLCHVARAAPRHESPSRAHAIAFRERRRLGSAASGLTLARPWQSPFGPTPAAGAAAVGLGSVMGTLACL
eukprot:6985389-Prymnesium_polylepis.1